MEKQRVERGVIYARYSAGSHQTEQSIEGQLRECKAYAKQNGIKIVGEYIDRKISGTTDNREQFLQMIADSKLHLFDVVVTYKTDRFSRDRYDAAVYKRALRINGVKIMYAKEYIPEGPEGIVLEGLLEAYAEYYSAELRQKIERGMIESAHKCKALGTMVFGYQKAVDGRYEINEAQAAVVRMIFQEYNAGKTLKDIANLAYPLGLRTRDGGVVQEARISKIIQNQKYIGVYEAYGVRIEDGIPAIVDKDTFFLAQKRLIYYQHHKGEHGGRGRAKADYLLSGKAFCGLCGQPLIGYSAYGRNDIYHYYACRARRRKFGCIKKTVYKDWLEKTVVQVTRQKVLEPQTISQIVSGCLQLEELQSGYAEKRRQIQSGIRQTNKGIENIVTAIADGYASESLKRRLADLEHQKALLHVQYNDLVNKPKMTEQQLRFMLSQGQGKTGESEEEYRKRMTSIFVHSVYLSDDKIVITYNLSSDGANQDFSMKEFSEFSDIETMLGKFTGTYTGAFALSSGALKQLASEPEDGSVAGCFFVCKNLYVIGRLLVCVAKIDVN